MPQGLGNAYTVLIAQQSCFIFLGLQILFGGASAGGIGMLSNVDHVAKMVRPARVLGYNDGGWFTLYRNYLEPTGSGAPEFLTTLRFVRTIYVCTVTFCQIICVH